MKNVCPAFEVWGRPEAEITVGYQKIKCQLIFDIKMGKKFHQARFFAGENTTETLPTLTYSSVVSVILSVFPY